MKIVLKYIFSDDLDARLTGKDAKELHRNLRDFTDLVSEENEIRSWNFLSTRISLLLRTYENIEVRVGIFCKLIMKAFHMCNLKRLYPVCIL